MNQSYDKSPYTNTKTTSIIGGEEIVQNIKFTKMVMFMTNDGQCNTNLHKDATKTFVFKNITD